MVFMTYNSNFWTCSASGCTWLCGFLRKSLFTWWKMLWSIYHFISGQKCTIPSRPYHRPRNVKRWKTKPSQRKTVPCRTSFEQYPRVWSFYQEEKDSQKQTYQAAPVLAAPKDRVGEKEQLQYQLESDSCLPWGPLWGWGGLLWGFLCWGHWWLPPVSVGIALREGEMRACRAMHGTVFGTYCPETEVRTEVWENLCRHQI